MDENIQVIEALQVIGTLIYANISSDREHKQPSKAYIDLLASFLTTIPISAYFK